MPNIWMSTSGTDTASGTTYALAVKTLLGAKAIGSQGDTIYVVNDGTYPMTNSTTTFVWAGTNYTSDVGLNITGVTSNATSALATFAATGSTNKKVMLFDDLVNYATVSGLVFDYTALRQVATGSMSPVTLQGNTRNIRFLDCEVVFTETFGATVTNTGAPSFPLFSGASVAHTGEIEIAGCVLHDASMKGPSNGSCAVNYHNNVIMHKGAGLAVNVPCVQFAVGTPPEDRRVYNNTLLTQAYGTDLAGAAMNSATDDTAVLYAHSNLIYQECGSGTAATGQSGSILDGYSLATQVDSTTMGYDLIALGPNISAFRSGWTTVGIASYQFSEDYRQGGTSSGSLVPDALSVLVTNAGLETVFNATTAAWTWTDPVGNGYDHTLPFDMRPIIARRTGFGDIAVGAVPAIVDPVPSTGTDTNVSNVFIDSLPFFRPILWADTLASVKVRRNDIEDHIDMRHYLTQHLNNESTHRRASIEAAASADLTFGGVSASQGVMIQTDNEVQVTLGTSGGGSLVVTVDDVAAFDNVALTSLSVSNTSSVTAIVEIAVFD